jgi:opacity protein-like surface antigen
MKATLKIVLCMAFLMALLAVPAAMAAQPDLGLKGIGARIGYMDPEAGDGAILFGANFDFGTWIEQLVWDGSIEYWTTGEDFGPYEYSYSNLALRSGVKYMFLPDQWRPFAGGGLGIHMFNFESEDQFGSYDDSDTELGFYIDGGVETDLSAKWTGAAEVRLDFVDFDQTSIVFTGTYRLGD